MASTTILKFLASERLQEAECLLANGHVAGAYYMGGYAIELALKAVICKKLGVEMFEKEAVPRHIAKSFMIHDLSDLVILAGIATQIENQRRLDNAFHLSWSMVSDWSEQRRYESACEAEKAKLFIFSIKIVMIWLQKNWQPCLQEFFRKQRRMV